MPAALEVEHLSKRFGSTLALNDVTWTVDQGASVVLFGPNGAGKTTLLRLCATLLRPSSGRVAVLGLNAAKDGAAVRRRIAVLGHESWLYPDLSPRENLRFYARLFGVANPMTRVDALIDRLGLVGWSHRPVGALSRGLVQRCALARLLSARARVALPRRTVHRARPRRARPALRRPARSAPARHHAVDEHARHEPRVVAVLIRDRAGTRPHRLDRSCRSRRCGGLRSALPRTHPAARDSAADCCSLT